MLFHENRLPADDSHEISCLICYFRKNDKIWNCLLLQIIGGTLRVKWMDPDYCDINIPMTLTNFKQEGNQGFNTLQAGKSCIFLVVCWLFLKINFFKTSFWEIYQKELHQRVWAGSKARYQPTGSKARFKPTGFKARYQPTGSKARVSADNTTRQSFYNFIYWAQILWHFRCFVCLDAIHPSQYFFSHVGTFPRSSQY